MDDIRSSQDETSHGDIAHSLSHDGQVPSTEETSTRRSDRLATLPSLTVLAAGFFSAVSLLPDGVLESINTMGGRGH